MTVDEVCKCIWDEDVNHQSRQQKELLPEGIKHLVHLLVDLSEYEAQVVRQTATKQKAR